MEALNFCRLQRALSAYISHVPMMVSQVTPDKHAMSIDNMAYRLMIVEKHVDYLDNF